MVAASLPAAREEVKEVEEFARQQGFKGKLERWDWSYYSEKLKNAKYRYNEERLSLTSRLEKVIDGVFLLANKVYGLTFYLMVKFLFTTRCKSIRGVRW